MKYLLPLIVLFLIGCGGKQPEPNIIKVKQLCHEDSTISRPDFLAEEGDDVQYTQAVFTNNELRKSYIYDLEAEINKCR